MRGKSGRRRGDGPVGGRIRRNRGGGGEVSKEGLGDTSLGMSLTLRQVTAGRTVEQSSSLAS